VVVDPKYTFPFHKFSYLLVWQHCSKTKFHRTRWRARTISSSQTPYLAMTSSWKKALIGWLKRNELKLSSRRLWWKEIY